MSQQPQQPIADQQPPQKTQQQLLQQQKQREEQQRQKQQQLRKQQQQARIKKEQDIKKLQQALKGSLSNTSLTKTNDNKSLIYSRLILAQKQLQRIFPNILQYKQILHLDLNTNQLSDISILNQFNNLVTLNVSKNNIANLNAFIQDDKLTKLQVLNISENKIKQLTQIGLPSLRRLNLSTNQIVTVKDWKGHSGIVLLQLRKNKLRKLKGLINMKNLQQLYVCENQITDLRGLQNVNSLKKLSLRNNKIKSIMNPFPYLPALTHLNLRQNQIPNIKQLIKIDNHIQSINILANPVSDELGQNLKKQIIWILPHFIKINKSQVTEQERILYEKQRLEKLAQQQKQRLQKQQQARKAAQQAALQANQGQEQPQQ